LASILPTGIGREHILAALEDLRAGIKHPFGRSVDYDVLHKGARYPPKAVFGLAASRVSGQAYGPRSFKGGLKSICFRILEKNGFEIVRKSDHQLFPDEVDRSEVHVEGAVTPVTVNRFERDPKG
jgi:hypothetical protein